MINQKRRIKFEMIQSVFLFSFVFLCILLPAADLFLSKKLLLIISFSLFFLDLCFFPRKKIVRLNSLLRILFLITIPLVFSFFTQNVPFETILFFSITSFSLLIFFPAQKNANFFLGSFLFSTNILALMTVIISISQMLPTDQIYSYLAKWFTSLDSGFLGVRNFGYLQIIMVHFRTAPVFIISFSIYFICYVNNPTIKRFLILCLQAIAILFSASRGTMLFAYMSVLLICIYYFDKKRYSFLFVFLICALVIIIIYALIYTNIFSLGEQSNSVKLGHIKSFIDFINTNPLTLIFGKGTGSSYYTKGVDMVLSQTEITYLDMIRYFGFPMAFVFVFCMSFPKRKTVLSIPFFLYYIDAATNPLIFCSTGMLVIALFLILQDHKSVDELIPSYQKKGGGCVFLYSNSNL